MPFLRSRPQKTPKEVYFIPKSLPLPLPTITGPIKDTTSKNPCPPIFFLDHHSCNTTKALSTAKSVHKKGHHEPSSTSLWLFQSQNTGPKRLLIESTWHFLCYSVCRYRHIKFKKTNKSGFNSMSNNKDFSCNIGAHRLETPEKDGDLGVLVDHRMTMSCQCNAAME